jgi:alkanesulfonate monooxygenase SsuD/methylene tetrahydromethanopterin reductase-like flavin-dependent oxidoreductase (luciferase family)
VRSTFRRAAERGHGWYGWSLDLDRTAACIDGLHEAQAQAARAPDLPALEVSVTPDLRVGLHGAMVAKYAALGVDRLIVLPPAASRQEPNVLLTFVDTFPAGVRDAA